MSFFSKQQEIWNTVLFALLDNIDILSYNYNECACVFSPRNIVRTKYHQITGFADPFLFVDKKDGYLYLFNERELLKAPAPLVAQRTKDLKHWEKLGIVLKEDFHLSFPFVFEYDGDYYMIPETRTQNAVILYKADSFPYGWHSVKNLVEGDAFVDSSVVLHKGVWYLFTTAWYGEKNGLRIFISDSLDGDYKEHPMSPITDDIAFSRCGGSIFSYKDNLYRPAQYCKNYYGENVVIYRIDELSPTIYSETKYKDVIDKGNWWNQRGGHQFNYVEYNGKQIVAIDGIGYDNWINNHTRKLFNFYYNHFQK